MILSENFPLEFRYGQEGYDLYAQIHTTLGNQLVHGVGMIFVVYGVFQMMNSFVRTKQSAADLMLSVYLGYLFYYSWFDPLGAFLSGLVYNLPLKKALYESSSTYSSEFRRRNFQKGLIYLIGSILVQEIIGHTLFEQTNSNLWELPNSLIIAPLFGANSLFLRSYW